MKSGAISLFSNIAGFSLRIHVGLVGRKSQGGVRILSECGLRSADNYTPALLKLEFRAGNAEELLIEGLGCPETLGGDPWSRLLQELGRSPE